MENLGGGGATGLNDTTKKEQRDGYAALEEDAQWALVADAIAGDDVAFERLYKTKVRLIYYYVNSLLGNIPEIDDVVQDICLKVYKGLKNLKDPELFNAWLYRVIRNCCMDRHRLIKRKVREISIEDYIENNPASEPAEEAIEFLPTEYMEDQARRDAVMRVVNRQSARAKQILIMCYFDDMSGKEIALALGLSVSTVTSTLSKLRTSMRADMEKEMRLLNEDTGMAGKGSKPTKKNKTVLGCAFASNAAMLFPAAKLDAAVAFQVAAAKSAAAAVAGVGAASGVSHVASHGLSLLSGKMAIVAASVVVGVSGVGFVASDVGSEWISSVYHGGGEQVVASAPVMSASDEAAWRNATIEFETASKENEYDNPTSAAIVFPFEVNGYSSCVYTIKDEAGVIVATGEGVAASEPFSELLAEEAYGVYSIEFVFVSTEGHELSLKREFAVLADPS
ncbi:MAG: sigma-70 family RNA polymerase sigma factor [Clostridiales Family XIII bacterium]|jgi:RNA polymerase sigma factor (sigma-70 family)|nr:sigma-70 family RNA polymerase sigma factor [Clostridiales Family XIII bacterium]